MTNHEKVANIISFIMILFCEDSHVMNKLIEMSPEYIMHKYDYYVLSDKSAYNWGLHPLIKERLFDMYVEIWGLELNDMDKC